MIHKGEMPFQCNICQKRFRVRSNLNFHIKKHKNNEIIKKKMFKNIKKYKNNKKNVNSRKKMIIEKKANYEIKDNTNFCICTSINSNNNCDYNNNYLNNINKENNILEHLDNNIEMKLINDDNCINNDFNNYIDFKENHLINFINTNEFEFERKSNISNKEDNIYYNDNYIINNNELSVFSDIDKYENQLSNNQNEEIYLKSFPSNLWDAFGLSNLNRFV
jgi:hypothetical protein